MKQKAWLARHKMPVSKVREIVRANGKLCLKCLSRPTHPGTQRCIECINAKNARREAGVRHDSA
jgi:hypothetical protein